MTICEADPLVTPEFLKMASKTLVWELLLEKVIMCL